MGFFKCEFCHVCYPLPNSCTFQTSHLLSTDMSSINKYKCHGKCVCAWVIYTNISSVKCVKNLSCFSSGCRRYILVSHAKQQTSEIVPTPLEEHLIPERFPVWGDRWLKETNKKPDLIRPRYQPLLPT